MGKPIINKIIAINASPVNVWRVFTDPAITKQMGGEYLTDWQVGSSFNWKAQDGNIYTNGIILQIEPGKLLKHSLSDLNNNNILLSIITYVFKEDNGGTILSAIEDINYEMNKEQLEEANAGWDIALSLVKNIAEKLSGYKETA